MATLPIQVQIPRSNWLVDNVMPMVIVASSLLFTIVNWKDIKPLLHTPTFWFALVLARTPASGAVPREVLLTPILPGQAVGVWLYNVGDALEPAARGPDFGNRPHGQHPAVPNGK